MAYNDDIVLTRGDYSVTIFTNKPVENLKNDLEILDPTADEGSEITGTAKSTIVDILKVSHKFNILGYITPNSSESKTAKEVKDDFITIIKGAYVSRIAPPITMTYDGDSYDVYIQEATITKDPNDNAAANYTGDDLAEYQVKFTAINGESM